MAESVSLRAEGDRIFLRVPSGFSGGLAGLVGTVRQQLPGVQVDWTAVREAYRFGRGRHFQVASRDPEESFSEKLKVRFSADGLTAYLLLFPPRLKGHRLEEEDLAERVAAYGIPPQILDRAALRRALLRRAYQAPEVIARGRPSVDGQPAWTHWLRGLPSDVDGFLAARESLEAYPEAVLGEAETGATVGQYHPPGLGSAGVSVRGEAIPARPGEGPVTFGSGIALAGDGASVVSTQSGHLRLTGVGGRHARVVPLLRVSDPQELREWSALAFPGSVIVEGDLEVAFPLRVLGDLEVRGALIRSSVEVLGSLFVRDGIIQRAREPVRVGNLAVAGFLDHASLQCHTALVRKYSLKSQIVALHRVLTEEGGSIQGGSVSAGSEVRAGILGATSGMATEVAAGTPTAADPFVQMYHAWVEALERQGAEQVPPDEELLDESHRWQEEGERLAPPDPASARIRAQTVHPGVGVRIGTAARSLDVQVSPAEFFFEQIGARGRIALNRG